MCFFITDINYLEDYWMKKLDLYIIIAVLVISGGLFAMFNMQPQVDQEVVIYVKGEEYARVPIDGKEHVYEIQNELGYNKIIVSGDGVRIEEADCPDHECILFGTLSRTGQSIICAPHYLVIEIVGNVDGGIDGVAI